MLSNIALKNNDAGMTSTQKRHELRYQRRKRKRDLKKQKFLKSLPSYDKVFSFMNLYNAFGYCKQNVRWKSSIQTYEVNLPINTAQIYEELKKQKWKTKGFTEFKICERGKMRDIKSVHISERCIQRAFCDHYLVPLITRNLIYDNGASLKGKGTSFALNRLYKHLYNHGKENARTGLARNYGYIMIFDFKNYFESIDHDVLFSIMDELMLDEKCRKLYHQLIDVFDKGLGLGSQVCQISAVAFPNMIDHYFKEKMGCKGFARYMDDGYIISSSLDFLKKCKKKLYELADKLKLKIHDNKIKICKLKNGFTFLKKRIRITETGKIIKRLCRKSIFAAKRRLKKMYELVENGKLTFKQAWNSYRSWRQTAIKYKNHYTIRRLDDLFNELFIRRWHGQNGLWLCDHWSEEQTA